MNNKLYVGGLPYSTTDQQLNEVFSQHGSVDSATVVTDRVTGRSRGFGFVEMSTPEEAQAAVSALDQTQMDGRNIKVNVAKPREKPGKLRRRQQHARRPRLVTVRP